MSKLRKLAGETVLYGLGSIVPRFLNFLLLPLHTAFFAPEAYGVITKLFAYVAVVNTVYMFGMETAYFRFASKQGADEKKIFDLTQTAVITISGLLTAGLIIFASPIARALEIPERADLVIWLAVIMFIDAVVAIPFARLRLQKKPLRFVLAKLINIAILAGLNVYFLVFASQGIRDVGFVVLANLIANSFYILFFARTLLLWRPRFDREISPSVFQYAYPVMLSGLAGLTNEMFSRIMLEAWLPKGFYPGKSTDYALGIFGATYKFAVLMNLGIQAFRYAAEPFFFSNASDKNSPQLFARVNHYFVIVCCLVLLGISINLDILKYFLGQPEYWEGLHIVPILLLAYLFLGMYYNFSTWFKLVDKTYYGTLITVGGAIITIGANYILIPLAGYEGSSCAALICYFCMAVACYLSGQKFYPIPYEMWKSAGYLTVTLLLVFAVNHVTIFSPLSATFFHSAVIVVFILIILIVERKGLQKWKAE